MTTVTPELIACFEQDGRPWTAAYVPRWWLDVVPHYLLEIDEDDINEILQLEEETYGIPFVPWGQLDMDTILEDVPMTNFRGSQGTLAYTELTHSIQEALQSSGLSFDDPITNNNSRPTTPADGRPEWVKKNKKKKKTAEKTNMHRRFGKTDEPDVFQTPVSTIMANAAEANKRRVAAVSPVDTVTVDRDNQSTPSPLNPVQLVEKDNTPLSPSSSSSQKQQQQPWKKMDQPITLEQGLESLRSTASTATPTSRTTTSKTTGKNPKSTTTTQSSLVPVVFTGSGSVGSNGSRRSLGSFLGRKKKNKVAPVDVDEQNDDSLSKFNSKLIQAESKKEQMKKGKMKSKFNEAPRGMYRRLDSSEGEQKSQQFLKMDKNQRQLQEKRAAAASSTTSEMAPIKEMPDHSAGTYHSTETSSETKQQPARIKQQQQPQRTVVDDGLQPWQREMRSKMISPNKPRTPRANTNPKIQIRLTNREELLKYDNTQPEERNVLPLNDPAIMEPLNPPKHNEKMEKKQVIMENTKPRKAPQLPKPKPKKGEKNISTGVVKETKQEQKPMQKDQKDSKPLVEKPQEKVQNVQPTWRDQKDSKPQHFQLEKPQEIVQQQQQHTVNKKSWNDSLESRLAQREALLDGVDPKEDRANVELKSQNTAAHQRDVVIQHSVAAVQTPRGKDPLKQPPPADDGLQPWQREQRSKILSPKKRSTPHNSNPKLQIRVTNREELLAHDSNDATNPAAEPKVVQAKPEVLKSQSLQVVEQKKVEAREAPKSKVVEPKKLEAREAPKTQPVQKVAEPKKVEPREAKSQSAKQSQFDNWNNGQPAAQQRDVQVRAIQQSVASPVPPQRGTDPTTPLKQPDDGLQPWQREQRSKILSPKKRSTPHNSNPKLQIRVTNREELLAHDGNDATNPAAEPSATVAKAKLKVPKSQPLQKVEANKVAPKSQVVQKVEEPKKVEPIQKVKEASKTQPVQKVVEPKQVEPNDASKSQSVQKLAELKKVEPQDASKSQPVQKVVELKKVEPKDASKSQPVQKGVELKKVEPKKMEPKPTEPVNEPPVKRSWQDQLKERQEAASSRPSSPQVGGSKKVPQHEVKIHATVPESSAPTSQPEQTPKKQPQSLQEKIRSSNVKPLPSQSSPSPRKSWKDQLNSSVSSNNSWQKQLKRQNSSSGKDWKNQLVKKTEASQKGWQEQLDSSQRSVGSISMSSSQRSKKGKKVEDPEFLNAKSWGNKLPRGDVSNKPGKVAGTGSQDVVPKATTASLSMIESKTVPMTPRASPPQEESTKESSKMIPTALAYTGSTPPPTEAKSPEITAEEEQALRKAMVSPTKDLWKDELSKKAKPWEPVDVSTPKEQQREISLKLKDTVAEETSALALPTLSVREQRATNETPAVQSSELNGVANPSKTEAFSLEETASEKESPSEQVEEIVEIEVVESEEASSHRVQESYSSYSEEMTMEESGESVAIEEVEIDDESGSSMTDMVLVMVSSDNDFDYDSDISWSTKQSAETPEYQARLKSEVWKRELQKLRKKREQGEPLVTMPL